MANRFLASKSGKRYRPLMMRVKCKDLQKRARNSAPPTKQTTCAVFSINLLASYHECRSLIGYVTRYLFCCR